MLHNTLLGLQLFKPSKKWNLGRNPVITISISLLHFFVYRFHFPISSTFISPSDDISFPWLGLTLRTAGHRIIRSGSRRSTSEHENSINQQNKPHRFAANHSSVLVLWHAPTFFEMKKKWENFFFLSNGNSIYLPCSSFSWFRILKFFFIFHVFVGGVSDDF